MPLVPLLLNDRIHGFDHFDKVTVIYSKFQIGLLVKTIVATGAMLRSSSWLALGISTRILQCLDGARTPLSAPYS